MRIRPSDAGGYAHGVISVLEEDRAVSFAVDGGIVTRLDQHSSLSFFLYFAVYEFGNVRVIDVEDYHLRCAARLSATLDDAGKRIETPHEAYRARGRAPA